MPPKSLDILKIDHLLCFILADSNFRPDRPRAGLSIILGTSDPNNEQYFHYLLHKGADSAVGFLHRLVKRLHFAAKESGEDKTAKSFVIGMSEEHPVKRSCKGANEPRRTIATADGNIVTTPSETTEMSLVSLGHSLPV